MKDESAKKIVLAFRKGFLVHQFIKFDGNKITISVSNWSNRGNWVGNFISWGKYISIGSGLINCGARGEVGVRWKGSSCNFLSRQKS